MYFYCAVDQAEIRLFIRLKLTNIMDNLDKYM